MFGWFRPKCPVPPETKAWIERRMGWLVAEFGRERLRDGEVILPDARYFPDPYDGTQDGARAILVRVCRYMDIDPARVALEFYAERRPVARNTGVVWHEGGTAGLYSAEEGQTTIWLEASRLADPLAVVATFAHELCHAHLLGEGRIRNDEIDHEPLTDLATIYFGLGVFTANASLQSRAYHAGNLEHWSISRLGYLPAPALAYGLALFAWLRGETSPAWASSLRRDVRSPLKQALAVLADADDEFLLEPETFADNKPAACPDDLLPKSARRPRYEEPSDENRPDAQHADDEPSDDALPTDADDYFSQAVIHMQAEQWNDAVRGFSLVLLHDPDDAEAYQQRALAYWHDRRPLEALADAEEAVRLQPEDPESYRVRGMARLDLGQCIEAIADFDRYFQYEELHSRNPACLAAVYSFRGQAHEGAGNLRRAVDDYSRAIANRPQWPTPYLARAEAYQRLGKPSKAQADRDEAARRAAEEGETPIRM